MTQTSQDEVAPQPAPDDHIVPFHVEGLDIRGRAIQLGPMLNTILDSHDYPEPVSRLLAEAVTLCILLGSSLKFEGRFLVQTQTDGPVSFMIVDFVTPGFVRAYARYDEQRLEAMDAVEQTSTVSLLGNGALAITVDQGSDSQRYQGVVALEGIDLEQAADLYFRQSEQIPTKVKLSVAQLVRSDKDNGAKTTWRAGGLLAQFLPEQKDRVHQIDLPGGADTESAHDDNTVDDAWAEAGSLVDTISDDELTDPSVGVERLLFRLFHQHDIRAYPSSKIEPRCGCSREKIVTIINGFSKDEQEESFAASKTPGTISSKCEFCGTLYEITKEEISA